MEKVMNVCQRSNKQKPLEKHFGPPPWLVEQLRREGREITARHTLHFLGEPEVVIALKLPFRDIPPSLRNFESWIQPVWMDDAGDWIRELPGDPSRNMRKIIDEVVAALKGNRQFIKVGKLGKNHPIQKMLAENRKPTGSQYGAILDTSGWERLACVKKFSRPSKVINRYVDMGTIIGMPYAGVLRKNSEADLRDAQEYHKTGGCKVLRLSYAFSVHLQIPADAEFVEDEEDDSLIMLPSIGSSSRAPASHQNLFDSTAWRKVAEALSSPKPVIDATNLIPATKVTTLPKVKRETTTQEDERNELLKESWNLDAVGYMNELGMLNDCCNLDRYMATDKPLEPNVKAIQVNIFNVPFIFFIAWRQIEDCEELLVSYGESYFISLANSEQQLNYFIKSEQSARKDLEDAKQHIKKQEVQIADKKMAVQAALERERIIHENESASMIAATNSTLTKLLKELDDSQQQSSVFEQIANERKSELDMIMEEYKQQVQTHATKSKHMMLENYRLKAQRRWGAASEAVQFQVCPYANAAYLHGMGTIHHVRADAEKHYRSGCSYARLWDEYIWQCRTCGLRLLKGIEESHEGNCPGSLPYHRNEIAKAEAQQELEREETLMGLELLSENSGTERMKIPFMQMIDRPYLLSFLRGLLLAVVQGVLKENNKKLEDILSPVDLARLDEVPTLSTYCGIISRYRHMIMERRLPKELHWILSFAEVWTQLHSDKEILNSRSFNEVFAMVEMASNQMGDSFNANFKNIVSARIEPLVIFSFPTLRESLQALRDNFFLTLRREHPEYWERHAYSVRSDNRSFDEVVQESTEDSLLPAAYKRRREDVGYVPVREAQTGSIPVVETTADITSLEDGELPQEESAPTAVKCEVDEVPKSPSALSIDSKAGKPGDVVKAEMKPEDALEVDMRIPVLVISASIREDKSVQRTKDTSYWESKTSQFGAFMWATLSMSGSDGWNPLLNISPATIDVRPLERDGPALSSSSALVKFTQDNCGFSIFPAPRLNTSFEIQMTFVVDWHQVSNNGRFESVFNKYQKNVVQICLLMPVLSVRRTSRDVPAPLLSIIGEGGLRGSEKKRLRAAYFAVGGVTWDRRDCMACARSVSLIDRELFGNAEHRVLLRIRNGRMDCFRIDDREVPPNEFDGIRQYALPPLGGAMEIAGFPVEFQHRINHIHEEGTRKPISMQPPTYINVTSLKFFSQLSF